MRGIEDMNFATAQNRTGKWVGTVFEFPTLKTRPFSSRLDAIDEIVRLTAQRISEIAEADA